MVLQREGHVLMAGRNVGERNADDMILILLDHDLEFCPISAPPQVSMRIDFVRNWYSALGPILS